MLLSWLDVYKRQIVRTVAEGKRVAELDAELKVLLKHWEETITKVQKAPKLPALVYEETSRTVAMLRDLFNPSYENIYVNDETVFHEIKDCLLYTSFQSL